MDKVKIAIVIATLALGVALGVAVFGSKSVSDQHIANISAQVAQGIPVNLGGMSNLDGLTIVPVEENDAFRLGSLGDDFTKFIATSTCNLDRRGGSVAASTTVFFDCRVVGARAGDIVFAQATSTMQNYWRVNGAQASSTDDFVSVGILSATTTGSSGIPGSTATTGLSVWLVRFLR